MNSSKVESNVIHLIVEENKAKAKVYQVIFFHVLLIAQQTYFVCSPAYVCVIKHFIKTD